MALERVVCWLRAKERQELVSYSDAGVVLDNLGNLGLYYRGFEFRNITFSDPNSNSAFHLANAKIHINSCISSMIQSTSYRYKGYISIFVLMAEIHHHHFFVSQSHLKDRDWDLP